MRRQIMLPVAFIGFRTTNSANGKSTQGRTNATYQLLGMASSQQVGFKRSGQLPKRMRTGIKSFKGYEQNDQTDDTVSIPPLKLHSSICESRWLKLQNIKLASQLTGASVHEADRRSATGSRKDQLSKI
ncbi:hypothetical protein C8024_01945 [Sphingopyxis sp. BSNA05]|nr:hypothetical protein [Sphingopyxis sp. BSNA05]